MDDLGPPRCPYCDVPCRETHKRRAGEPAGPAWECPYPGCEALVTHVDIAQWRAEDDLVEVAEELASIVGIIRGIQAGAYDPSHLWEFRCRDRLETALETLVEATRVLMPTPTPSYGGDDG